MPTIYVGGPVQRHGVKQEKELASAYRAIETAAESSFSKVQLPHAEAKLDKMIAGAFFDEIRGRIDAADAVITIHTGTDISSVVESTIAAMSGKRHVVITDSTANKPRLLEGLPGLRRVIKIDSPTLEDDIRKFIESIGEGVALA